MPRLLIANRTQESCSDCSWTEELVTLSAGDLHLDGEPFGTYVAALYPQSGRSPQFIINVLDALGRPLLSFPCEYTPNSSVTVRPLKPKHSPWSEDGVLYGPMLGESEHAAYARASDAFLVAQELVLVEPSLVAYRSEASQETPSN
jgi:hypothetical protein